MLQDFEVECPWCQQVLLVTLDLWQDAETHEPRMKFRNTPQQAATNHEHWLTHAEQREAVLTGEISAPPSRPGRPVGTRRRGPMEPPQG